MYCRSHRLPMSAQRPQPFQAKQNISETWLNPGQLPDVQIHPNPSFHFSMVFGFLYFSMIFYDFLWFSMVFYGFLCFSVVFLHVGWGSPGGLQPSLELRPSLPAAAARRPGAELAADRWGRPGGAWGWGVRWFSKGP